LIPPRRGGGGSDATLKERLGIGLGIAAIVGSLTLFAFVIVFTYDLLHGDKLSRPTRLAPVQLAGPEHTVFSWSRDACEPRDIPDLPARAFRDSNGAVRLIAPHYVNRGFVGPDLGHLRHPCAVIMRSRNDANPAAYAGREWIASPYSPDGKRVYALVHNEYHGTQAPGQCASNDSLKCWYNAITFAISTNGGRTFKMASGPGGHLIASVPYPYEPDAGPFGLFAPTDIVRDRDDGYFYAMVRAEQYRAQAYGSCLMRTKTLANPTSWRAWDGDGFDIRFVNPYTDPGVRASDHVCTPVSPKQIAGMAESLTFNTYFGKWLLVGSSQAYVLSERRNVAGIYYSLSDDLVHWTQRRLIREVEFVWTYQCGDPSPIAYPSVLDPRSTSRNFETSGRSVELYFTRLHYANCRQSLNRDLVRVPIRFSK
jgi:hypothetical protein